MKQQHTLINTDRASMPSMKYLSIIILLLSVLSACKPPENTTTSTTTNSNGQTTVNQTTDTGTQIKLELATDPALGTVPVHVYILKDGNGVEGAEVEVTGTMTHAGMVPVIVDASEVEPGHYSSDAFEFTMAGDWIITADIALPDGEKTSVETTTVVPGQ